MAFSVRPRTVLPTVMGIIQNGSRSEDLFRNLLCRSIASADTDLNLPETPGLGAFIASKTSVQSPEENLFNVPLENLPGQSAQFVIENPYCYVPHPQRTIREIAFLELAAFSSVP